MAAWKFKGGDIFAAFDPEETNFKRFSCRFETIEKEVDILTGKEKIVVKISNGYSNPEVMLPREAISEDTIVDTLTAYGISVSNQKPVRALVKDIITVTEETATKTLVFDKLGFVNIGGKEYYLADKLYSFEESELNGAVFKSAEMHPKGTLQQYRKFLIREVSKSPKLALALSLGVTAPVAHILKKYGAFYETLLWSFCGESSIGKTTSLLAMLSLFGNPQFLMSNVNATGNALETQVSFHAGLPFVADEATRSKINFDETIYSLASGKSRRRCNGDGSLKEIVNFSGAVFFSSEQPILDKCTEQGGEEARVIDFELNWFDGDGGKAKKFLSFFNSHYGVGIGSLAPLLLDTEIQKKVVRYFLKAQQKLAIKVQIKDGIDDRIVQRLAIIAVSCWLLEKAIKVDLHLTDIVDLLVSIFEEKQTRICRTDGAERLLQLFVEDYIHNKDKYSTDKNVKKSARHSGYSMTSYVGSARGMLSKFQGRDCLWLPTGTFNEILSRQTTYGANTAKNKLHEKGHLQKFGVSYYRWCNFGATSANAYCVFLPSQPETPHDDVEMDTESSLQITPTPTLIAGFVGLTSQDVAMIINAELGARLGIKTRGLLFLHTWGEKDFLLLSSEPSEKAIPLGFEKVNNSFVSKSASLSAALKATRLNVGRRERLLLSDISVAGKKTSATIYTDNPYGQLHEPVNTNDPYSIRDPYYHKPLDKSYSRSLLEDDEDKQAFQTK